MQLTEENFASHYMAAYGTMKSTAYSILHDWGLAEDVASETALIAYTKRQEFRGRSSPQTWMHRIAINYAIMQKRKMLTKKMGGGKICSLSDTREIRSPDGSPEKTLLRKEIYEAVSGIPASHRKVIELIYYHGFTLAETAEILDIPLGTAKSRRFYGIQRLKEIFR